MTLGEPPKRLRAGPVRPTVRGMSCLFRSVLLAAIAVSFASACSRETPTGEGAFANELKGAPPGPRGPVAKGGIADDTIKPGPIAPVAPVAKGGIPDDSIKPRIPTPLPKPAPR